MKADMGWQLRSTQRMLRRIIGTSRLLVNIANANDTQSLSSSSSSNAAPEEDQYEQRNETMQEEDKDLVLEDWVDWIIRATGIVDADRIKADMEDWERAQ